MPVDTLSQLNQCSLLGTPQIALDTGGSAYLCYAILVSSCDLIHPADARLALDGWDSILQEVDRGDLD